MDVSGQPAPEWFPKRTFAEVLEHTAGRLPDRVALRFHDHSWTFGLLEAEADRLAKGLIGLGVQPGDRVAVWLDNRPEWVLFFFAAAKVGAVVAPFSTAFRARELKTVLRHSKARWLVLAAGAGSVSYLDIARQAFPFGSTGEGMSGATDPEPPRVILLDAEAEGCATIGDVISAEEGVGEDDLHERADRVDPDDLALLLYTSGSTGTPKGVMLSHSAIRNITDQGTRLGVRESDVILMYLPLFHALGLYEGPLLSVISGARMVLMERFEPGLVLRAIGEERVTMCFGFATHFHDLVNHPDFETTDLSSLRTGILAAGPRAVEPLARRAQAAFGNKFVSAWGLTEIGAAATLGFLDDDVEHRVATSGYPSPGYEIRVLNPDTGEEEPRGTPGEVWVRTYQMMLGYFLDPERTEEAVDSDGWLRTGDMGIHQEDGYLRIVGRYKDVLKVGGENVDPSEVEQVFLELASVAAVIVVGLPDERLGEVVCLCVVPAAGVEAGAELEQELNRVARDQLAHFKRPRMVVFMDEVPLTEAGKVHRKRARELALAQFGNP